MYIYVLGHRDGRFCDVYIRPVAVNGLRWFIVFGTLTGNPYSKIKNLVTLVESQQK